MKRIAPFTALLFQLVLLVQAAYAQPEASGQAGTTLPQFISKLADADEVSAIDYLNLASGTVHVAEAMSQQGQVLPKGALLDALDAVSAGRSLSPEMPGWDPIEQRLQKLLEQQEQPQPSDAQNSESLNDDGEQDQGQQSGEQKQQSGEGSESDSESGTQDESQASEEGGESDEQSSTEGNSEEGQSGEQGEDGEESPQAPAQDGAQMGELPSPESMQELQLDDAAGEQGQPEEMQTLGGQQNAAEPIQADKAAMLRMLEQLKQQDEPGKLYMILQEAQQGKRKQSQPDSKDW